MLASGRVHPASYEKPAPTERTQGRIEGYQVGEENEDDARCRQRKQDKLKS